MLIGGPDWPTSVVAGIFKTNVFWNLLGTLFVFPCIALTLAMPRLAMGMVVRMCV